MANSVPDAARIATKAFEGVDINEPKESIKEKMKKNISKLNIKGFIEEKIFKPEAETLVSGSGGEMFDTVMEKMANFLAANGNAVDDFIAMLVDMAVDILDTLHKAAPPEETVKEITVRATEIFAGTLDRLLMLADPIAKYGGRWIGRGVVMGAETVLLAPETGGIGEVPLVAEQFLKGLGGDAKEFVLNDAPGLVKGLIRGRDSGALSTDGDFKLTYAPAALLDEWKRMVVVTRLAAQRYPWNDPAGLDMRTAVLARICEKNIEDKEAKWACYAKSINSVCQDSRVSSTNTATMSTRSRKHR